MHHKSRSTTTSAFHEIPRQFRSCLKFSDIRISRKFISTYFSNCLGILQNALISRSAGNIYTIDDIVSLKIIKLIINREKNAKNFKIIILLESLNF